MGRLAGLLLKTVAGTGREAAYVFGQQQMQQQGHKHREASTEEGCKPCEAAAKVDAARERFMPGATKPAPRTRKKKPMKSAAKKGPAKARTAKPKLAKPKGAKPKAKPMKAPKRASKGAFKR